MTCARSQQGAQALLMARATIAKHDDFNQRCPVQVVDMVQRRARSNQLLDHPIMTQMRGGDQGGAVVAAGDQFRAGTLCQQHA